MTAIVQMTEEEWGRCPKDDGGGFGAVQTSEGNLPMKAMDVKANVVGLTATTRVSQTFRNAYKKPLEATYIFPLPPGGAVKNLRIRIADREVIGELKERGEARAEYDQAIAQGHRASIVEEDRPDVFNLRAGNIAPGEEMTVTFDVVELLPVTDGEVTFRFPLVVAPRYVPGTPLEGASVGVGVTPDTDAVPDASRISPPVLLAGMPNPIALSLSVQINEAGLAVKNLRSSLHAISSVERGAKKVEIVPGERLNRDFILRFDIDANEMANGFVLSPDDVGSGGTISGGTFAVTLVPETTQSRAPRDVVFVLDRSGSMGGWKMVAARRAIGRMIDTLTDGDRFSVMAFDTSIDLFLDQHLLIDATNRNRFRAVEWLAKIDARGGTEIMEPMLRAVDSLTGGYQDRVKTVVLVTDGQVGNEREIVQSVGKKIGNVRIHTVGIDEAVNSGFLTALANLGGGVCELVESEDRLDDAMDRIHRTIGSAILRELSLTFDGIEIETDSLPARLPDVYDGIATVIMGRYRSATSPQVNVLGVAPDGAAMRIDVSGTVFKNDAFGPIWARRHIRDLDDRWNVGVESRPKLEARLVETSLTFGVLSRFTAFVAVDRAEKVETGDIVQVTQPVESPSGWSHAASPSFHAPMQPMQPMAASAPGSGGYGAGGPSGPPPSTRRASSPRKKEKARSLVVAQSAPADFEQADDFLSYDGIVAESPAEARFDSTIDADEGASYTRSGGAPYIGAGSPESLTGQPYDEPRAIVFMLGALLHHALTGKPLFTAGTNYIMEVMQWNISQLDPNVLGSWYGFLCRALNPDPSARFENPTEFVAEMNAIARHDEMIGDAKELYRLLSSAGLNVRLAAVRAVAEHASLQFVNVNTLGPNTIWVDDHGVHFGGPPAPPKKKPFWKR